MTLPEVWRWSDIVAHLKRADRSDEHGTIPAPDAFTVAVLDCPALFNAIHSTEETTVGDVIERIEKIESLLRAVKLVRNHPEDLKAAYRELEAQKGVKAEILERLRSTASMTIEPYRSTALKSIEELNAAHFVAPSTMYANARLLADYFDVSTVGTRGAADNDAGALRGWAIRELDQLLSPTAIDRFATIRHLLKLAGLDGISKTLPRTILTKGKGRTAAAR